MAYPSFKPEEIEFKEMPEFQVDAAFREDGYDGWRKRSERGQLLPFDSTWYTTPARMFLAISKVEDETKDRPVGVIGFAPIGDGRYAMGAGIHTRVPIGRKRDLAPILIDKLLEEKGSSKIFINFTSAAAVKLYRNAGFHDIDLENLPEDLPEHMKIELLQASKHPKLIEQLQKTMMYSVPQWFDTLKRGN